MMMIHIMKMMLNSKPRATSHLLITTGEFAERQIDVESNCVEGEEEGEEEVLDEVA